MFQVGKLYDIRMYENGAVEEGVTLYGARRVVAVEGPLIKIVVDDEETIINTTSPAFFSAELRRDQ